ncbi:SDR family oxidoreductase [Sinorhizobium sp. RAC02]|uniref:SDR family NAD(P)-dependent oxidoreductase n=1 Tax=Sinorhizobium sp. RAC02 TaxID=1842534 RepID=UPI00083E5D08|nr:SDR family oxidoreductase [Sinorhizobium sp. RAC02]AOF92211.1 short chain dehydrogenase family protein [Sinorhizobium sp. RAC02]
MRFEGKVVVITGAAQGIGRATAERFLSEGAKVVISDVNEERLKATASEIGSPDTLLSVVTDVSRKDQVEALVAKAVERFGHIDVMVNNAGICPIVPFLDVTEETYDKVLDVNLKGAFFGTQAAGRQMIAQGRGGVIINMSSVNSGLANPNVAPYAISKGGMNQITGTAAVAFAPHDIRVAGVGPGTIMSEMVAGDFINTAGHKAIMMRTPMGRYGEPDEIASVVAFLASDDASFITGETIYPDGGRRVLNYVMPAKED